MPKGLGTIHMQKVSCFSFPSFLIRQECLIVRIYKRDDDVLLQHITLSLLLLSLMQMNRALSLRCKEKTSLVIPGLILELCDKVCADSILHTSKLKMYR